MGTFRYAHRALALTVLAATSLSGLAFAPAAAQDETSRPGGSSVLDGLTYEVSPDGSVARSVEGLQQPLGLEVGDDLRKVGTWRAAMRRATEAAGHETFSLLDACMDCGSDEMDEDSGSSSYTYTYAVDDLNGDGNDDVITETYTYEGATDTESVKSVARSGRTGKRLWARTSGGADQYGFTFVVGDVDGVAGNDLVHVSFAGSGDEEQCTVLAGGYCGSFSYTDLVTVTTLSGRTGKDIASFTVTSDIAVTESFQYADAPIGVVMSEGYEVTVESGFGWLTTIDRSGNGTLELLLERFDLTVRVDAAGVMVEGGPLFGFAYGMAVQEQLTGWIELMSGRTGALVDTVVWEDAIAIATVIERASGDVVVVDVHPDLGRLFFGCGYVDGGLDECHSDRELPVSPGNRAEPTRQLLGKNLQTVWEAPITADFSWIQPAGGDLNGDRVADLFELSFSFDDWDETLTAIDGATGQGLWSGPGGIATVSKGAVVAATVAFKGDAMIVDALRLDGRTGDVLSRRRVAKVGFAEYDGEDDVFMEAYVSIGLLDLLGKGTDVAVEHYAATYSGSIECETFYDEDSGTEYEDCWYSMGEILAEEGRAVGVSGRTMKTLFTVNLLKSHLMAIADVDGDRVAELLVQSRDPRPGRSQLRARKIGGGTLWTLGQEQYLGGLLHGRDGRVDLIVDDWRAMKTRVLTGRNLKQRWAMRMPVFEESWFGFGFSEA